MVISIYQGIIFDFYKSVNADNPDTLRQTEVFEGMLGQQGILNNMFRIWRNVIFGFVLRFLINLFTYPTETITDLSTRGLNMYSERTFTPTFTTSETRPFAEFCKQKWPLFRFQTTSRLPCLMG